MKLIIRTSDLATWSAASSILGPAQNVKTSLVQAGDLSQHQAHLCKFEEKREHLYILTLHLH